MLRRSSVASSPLRPWTHCRAGSALAETQRRDYPRELHVIKMQVWTELPHKHTHRVCVCVCLKLAHDFNNSPNCVGVCEPLCLVCWLEETSAHKLNSFHPFLTQMDASHTILVLTLTLLQMFAPHPRISAESLCFFVVFQVQDWFGFSHDGWTLFDLEPV